MDIGHFQFHRRALAAFNELSAEDQAQVCERLARLADVPPGRWPSHIIK